MTEPVVLVVTDDDGDGDGDGDGASALTAALTGSGLRPVATGGAGAAAALAGIDGGAGVAVVGVGPAGDAAARAALDDGRVAALALLDAALDPATLAMVQEWEELPLFTVADPAHRPALRTAVEAYLGSSHAGSDLVVGPIDDATVGAVAGWLDRQLASVASVEEVVVVADDGWEIHGTRWLPATEQPVPGIVLLHSGRSDRAVFSRLERLLAAAGFAVLNVDWRGRGRSVGRGTYFSLSAEERAEGWRDAAAAFAHLASLPGVDADRLGSVGVIHGAEHAARAAQRDDRVKALVILTGYRPGDDAEGAHLTSGAVDVLYVTSADHRITTDAMRLLHDASPPTASTYVEYPGGAIGYQLFDLDPGLEPRIVTWLGEVLAR